jgi:hypothetical protein
VLTRTILLLREEEKFMALYINIFPSSLKEGLGMLKKSYLTAKNSKKAQSTRR